MTLSVCAVQGCPDLTASTYCEQHYTAKQKEWRKRWPDKRPSATKRGYDTKWRAFRSRFLQAHPICMDEAGCVSKATDVDHIDGLGPKGPRGYDTKNCRALCHSHHSQRTAKDQPGGWNA